MKVMTVRRISSRKKSRKRGHASKTIKSEGVRWKLSLSDLAIELLLNETLAFFLAAGVERDRISANLRDKARRIAQGRTIKAPRASSHHRLVDAAGVVHDWFRLRRYTNKETGQPVPLRVAELRRLIRKRFPQRSVDAVLAWMQQNGFIQARSRGSFALSVDRQVIIGQPRALALERTANLAPQLLKTALRNARTPRRQDRDVDRDARVFHLPASYVPQFRAMSRRCTKDVLEFVDNWLEDRNATDFKGQTVEASMHVYTHTSESRDMSYRTGRRHSGGRVL
jgi:hypothetical protein